MAVQRALAERWTPLRWSLKVLVIGTLGHDQLEGLGQDVRHTRPAGPRGNGMSCYFQGCGGKGTTKEHIPPRAFFPDNERHQLLTVKSCLLHNGGKSTDDLYVLAHICMNASPSNRAREIFFQRVAPQLAHNDGKLLALLNRDSEPHGDGVAYVLDMNRFDAFFTALSYGLVFKSQKAQLPDRYRIQHIYHRLGLPGDHRPPVEAFLEGFYASDPPGLMEFGTPETRNERIYSVKIFGVAGYGGSITLVHTFFGVFKVTSMLTMMWPPPDHDAT